MLVYKYLTKNKKHEYSFEFKGNKYHIHSVVKLTERGKKYLGARTHEAILTEVFLGWNNMRFWKYEFRSIEGFGHITNASTDIPPDNLIAEVIAPASGNYMLREIVGSQWNASSETRHTKKDMEIPEVRIGWIIFVAVSLLAFIFKDWYLTLMIQIVALIWFVQYRKQHIDANTVYTYDEDTEMLKSKYNILYGLKNNKESANDE